MKKLLLIPALLLGLAAPVTAQAQTQTTQTADQKQQAPLELRLEDFIVTEVTSPEGKIVEKLIPDASTVLPNQVIQYELTAENHLKQPLTGVKPTLAVPDSTIFVASSTNGADNIVTEYSYDGGKTFGTAPLFKTVTVTENGKTVTKKVKVQPYEYTNVRWNLGKLKGDAQQKLILRVRVR